MRAIIGRLVMLAVAALVVVGPLRGPAEAESYEYTPKKRQVKACILLLESFKAGGVMENPDPHVFYVLESKAEKIKPRDWEIVNPLAPRVVTADIRTRWNTIDPTHPYALNQAVTKNMACYWEVPLSSTSIEDLLQFDLVAVMTHASGGFSVEDSAKLRRLVDLGGTFWFDDCAGATLSGSKPFFIHDFNYKSGVSALNNPSPTLGIADRLHPILNNPFHMTRQDLEQLGDKGAMHYTYRITNLAGDGLPDPNLAPIVNSLGQFPGVATGVWDGITYPVVVGGHYGDGAVVITSGDIGCAVNDRFGNGPYALSGNNGAFCGDLPANWSAADQSKVDCNMKFVYNLLNWTAGEANQRKGAHRSGYTRDEVTPSVDALWKVPLGSSVTLSTPPVTWRDFTFFGTDEGRVFAVDNRPAEDRDGNADNGEANDGGPNPNDGIQSGWGTLPDLTASTPYDVVWRYPSDPEKPLPARPAGMHVATVILNDGSTPPKQIPVDALFFTTQDGYLHAVQATPMVQNPDVIDPVTGQPVLVLASGQPTDGATEKELTGYPVQVTAATLVNDGAVSPPVVNRQIVYVVTREAGTPNGYWLTMIHAATGALLAKVPLSPAQTGGDDSFVFTLPPVTSALVDSERNRGTADMVYVALPNGAMASVAMQVFGEVADPCEKWVQASKTYQDADTKVFRLQHAPVWPSTNAIWATWTWGVWTPPAGWETQPVVTAYDASNKQIACTWGLVATDPCQLTVTAAGGVPLPGGCRVVVSYTVNVRDPKNGVRDRVWVPGYNTDLTTPTAWNDPPARPTPGVGSGSAVAAGDANYLCGANGLVQAVAERGERTTNNTADPQLTDLNYVFWRTGVNEYVEDSLAGRELDGRPKQFNRLTVTTGVDTYSEITWVPGWWDGQRWVPLPPATTNGMVYVAMNQYAMKRNGTEARILLGGAVFAFDMVDKAVIDLRKDALGNTVNLNALNANQVTVYRYLPEGTTNKAPGWSTTTPTATCDWSVPLPLPRDIDGNVTAARIELGDFSDQFAFCPSLKLADGTQTSWVWVDVDGAAAVEHPRPFLVNGGLSNLVWRYPDPNWQGLAWDNTAPAKAKWAKGVVSPPTVSGGVVYVGLADGRLFALDADPRDASRPAGATTAAGYKLVDDGLQDGDGDADVADGFLLTNLSLPREWSIGAQRVPPDVIAVWPQLDSPTVPQAACAGIWGGVTATSGLLLLSRNDTNATTGLLKSGTLYALSRPVYTVADSKRMMEIDGDGRLLTLMAEAKGDAGQKAINHPAAAHFAGDLSVDGQATVFADTGNNRVVAVDRSGNVLWEAGEVYDLDGILPPGEFDVVSQVSVPFVPAYDSTGDGKPDPFSAHTDVRVAKLKTPTDVRSWQSYDVNADGTTNRSVLVQHTLVADAGNYRVMEIVDKWQWNAGNLRWERMRRSDVTHGNPFWYHVVVWASQTRSRHKDLSEQWQNGQDYRYTSLQVVDYYPSEGYYAKRVLCTVSNYALSRVGGKRQQQVGASLVMLDSDPTQALPNKGRSFIVDVPGGEQGYCCAIGNAADLTKPRFMSGLGVIQRYRYAWTAATGTVYHYLYADNTGIYEWVPKAGQANRIPLADGQNYVDPSSTVLYSQFWREHYTTILGTHTDGTPLNGDPRQFQPGAVTVDPAGGWIITNRVFDRMLSQSMQKAGLDTDARRIQVFKVASTPAPGGDYDTTKTNFGYTRQSVHWLFGPELRDLARRDLKVDLAQPMYTLRSW